MINALLRLFLVFAIVSPSTAAFIASDLDFSATHFDTAVAKKHLMVLASDDMRGRNTPSPELERSAQYLADQFRSIGCKPINGSYFHTYQLQLLDLASPTTLTIVRGTDTMRCALKTDFSPYAKTGEGAVNNAPVVFAGYGITAPALGYNDYADIDVTGAVVVVFYGEPRVADSTKPFGGRGQTVYASTDAKLANAKQRGAVAMIVLDPMRSGKPPRVFGATWPSLYPEQGVEHHPVSLGEQEPTLPLISVGERPATSIFGSVVELASERALIDSTLRPRSRRINGITMSCNVALHRKRDTVKNVVGVIRGAKVPHEYVIVGAHYDHVGVGKPINGDSIFNGADDNASGTTGLLLSAQALVDMSTPPERSIVFVAFSGEERGLLGSKAYTDDSPLPLDSCVAMINMDMIGRCESNNLSIGGDRYCPDLVAINEEENKKLSRPLTLAYNIERYFFRSDQANFAAKKIPVLFYFTGEHKDYHKVTDEISKLNLTSMVNITQLVTRVVWRAAQQPRTRYLPMGESEQR